MSIDSTEIKKAADLIVESDNITVLTGAGMSVESGIAPFRGEDGLWDRFDPQEYASMEAFRDDPKKCWELFRLQIEEIRAAEPHKGHRALVELEEQGVKTVITQNVDSLHQEAGSRDVIELHGSFSRLVCLECKKSYDTDEYLDEIDSCSAPVCRCGAILKPEAILFGESLPFKVLKRTQRAAEGCDLMMVIGTSAVVQPAASLPHIAKENDADVVEINLEKTQITEIADVVIGGKVGEILPEITTII